MTKTPERRKRRWPRIVLGVVVVAGVVLALVLRSPSPAGHWNSAEGYQDYLDKYDRAMKDVPAPTLVRDIRTEYGLVRVYRFNGTGARSATPLVLLPGTSSGTPVWADNLPSLLKIGDVYTFDLLGEPGMSIQSRPIKTSEDKAAWLDQTLAALPEKKFDLVGLSIGGWTATNYTLRHPDRVATLTLLDAINVFDGMPLETIVRSIPAAVKWLPRSWRDSFNSYTAGGAPVEDVPVADLIESGMKNYTMRQPQPERISEQQLGTLKLPVLAIIAGKSVMHDPPKARSTADNALPNKTVKFYPDASHAINGEYPDQLAADLQAFLTAQR